MNQRYKVVSYRRFRLVYHCDKAVLNVDPLGHGHITTRDGLVVLTAKIVFVRVLALWRVNAGW